MRNNLSVGCARESLEIFKKYVLPNGIRLDYQPLFEKGARAPPSELSIRGGMWAGLEWAAEIEPAVVTTVYNGGFSRESRRSGRLTCRENFFSCNKVYVHSFWQNVGLFIILDMAAERNALMERIYPRLKEFAQEKGYEFQVGLIKLNYLLFSLFYFRHDIPCVLDRRYPGLSY